MTDMDFSRSDILMGPLFGEAGEPDPPPFPEKPVPTEPTVEPPKRSPEILPPKDPPGSNPGREVDYPSPDLPGKPEITPPVR